MNNRRTVIHKPNILYLSFICLSSALGGFLWGFDAIVISGTISSVKTQFALSSGMEGLFVSSGLIGAVIGSALAGWLSDRFGRSRNLVLAAALMFISALGSGLAPTIEWLILARWIGGLGVGISAMVCPLYISEVSPTHLRGSMVTAFQFAITVGILVAVLSNAALFGLAQKVGQHVQSGFWKWFLVDETWRAMFAVEMIPGLFYISMAFVLPESPRWLMKMGKTEQAQAILSRIFQNGAEQEAQDIEETIALEEATQGRYADLLDGRYRRHLVVAILLAVFAQFSGINVVFYYGPSILEEAGFEIGGALSGFATIGFFSMIFTMVSVWLVDKLGRRTLMQIGTTGAIACLGGIGLSMTGNPGALLIALICGFVACFAFSLGPIKFIFASEIFPTNIRSHAMSVVILAMWLADTLVGQIFPMLRDTVGASGTFFIFAAILLPQIGMVWKWMPETAGQSLEDIERWYNKEERG